MTFQVTIEPCPSGGFHWVLVDPEDDAALATGHAWNWPTAVAQAGTMIGRAMLDRFGLPVREEGLN